MNDNTALGFLKRAGVAGNGAVLLGSSVACDAHAERPVRIVTHAHSDHIVGLAKSIDACEIVLMTPATRDILKFLRSKRALLSPKVRALSYMTPFHYNGETITLYEASHIPGSAQVAVHTEDDIRIIYTGDFKLPGSPILPADILVIEATYGSPAHVRGFEQMVEAEFISLIEQSVTRLPVFIMGYHGKLQQVLQLLGRARIGVPVILQEKVYLVARALEKHGLLFDEYALASADGLQSEEPFVALFHAMTKREFPRRAVKVFLSGWQFSNPIRATGPNEYTVALSGHSDFRGLMEYVEKSKPKFVITDGYRSRNAKALAAQIQSRLGIPAKAMP